MYKRHRFPLEIIQYAVWLYCRFNLSHRDMEFGMHECIGLVANSREQSPVSAYGLPFDPALLFSTGHGAYRRAR